MTGHRRHSAMRSVLAPAFALACLVVVLVVSPARADAVLSVGDKVAELDVGTTPAGKSFKLKSLKGKWVVVTIGASWCKPCKKELPTWDKMAGLLKDKVVFVALNVDEDKVDGEKFNQQLKLKNMTLVYLGGKSAVAARYGSDTMPSTFVVDGNQVIKFRKDGFQERDADGEYKKLRTKLSELGIK